MRNIIISYLSVLAVFTAVDILWLSTVAINFYRSELGTLVLDKPRLDSALIFYALYAAGITILAVQPSLNGDEWQRALILGAVFGVCAYGTYDLTNLATLRGWSLRLTIVDIVWGTLLTAFASWVGFFAGRLSSSGVG